MTPEPMLVRENGQLAYRVPLGNGQVEIVPVPNHGWVSAVRFDGEVDILHADDGRWRLVRTVAVLAVVLALMVGCAHHPAPARPRADRVRWGLDLPDRDLVCANVNYPSTCATVADVRVFLLSRSAGP